MKDSKLRNIVKEVLKEELGREMRYAVTMDFYVYADSNEEAVAHAKIIASDMDSKLDNKASIVRIDKREGAMGSEPIDFARLEEGVMKMLRRKFARGISDEQKAYNKKHGLPDDWDGSKEGFYEKNGEGNSAPKGSN